MKTYLVGGAVRDELLQFPIIERDYVVVGATPEQLIAQGFQAVGKSFPVFLHPETKEEYALARTERKNGHGYHGFEFFTSPEITLEQDLYRRDLTINAIAKDENGTFFDPYHGKIDLEQRILRHISPAFSEDPLRVLRVARFAARYYDYGFQIAPETLVLMQNISQSGELQFLSAERIWKETEKALNEKHAEVYFQILDKCHALEQLFLPLAQLKSYTVPKHQHSRYDIALKQLNVACKNKLPINSRYAILCYQFKYTQNPIQQIKQFSQTLKVPQDYTYLALKVIEHADHLAHFHHLTALQIWQMIRHLDIFRQHIYIQILINTCECLFSEQYDTQTQQQCSKNSQSKLLIIKQLSF